MNKMTYRYASAFAAVLGVFVVGYFSMEKKGENSVPGTIVWRSLNEGIADARMSHRKILIDVYTDWCSWCKKMDTEVYTNEHISRLLNEHFVAVKLNAESNSQVSFKGNDLTEADLARQLGVTGYPTTLFFDQDSNPITDVSGYLPPERFEGVLDFIGNDHYKTTSFEDFSKNRPAPNH